MTGNIINGDIHVILSRRNLRSLLLKLDRESSLRTLCRRQGDGLPNLVITAEDDLTHYVDREAGEVHPIEEALMAREHSNTADRSTHAGPSAPDRDLRDRAERAEGQRDALKDFLDSCLCGECGGSGRTDNYVTGEVECGSCGGTGHDSRKAFARAESAEASLAALTAAHARLRALDRYNVEIGGCGDPSCCGSYIETERAKDGDYVKWTDLEAALAPPEGTDAAVASSMGHYCDDRR